MTTATKKQVKPKRQKQIIAAYDYIDENGILLYQSIRFEDKNFAYRRPNPKNPPDPERRLDPNDPDDRKHWLWELGDTKLIPYHLPQWLKFSKQDYQIIVEGEKDVETLENLGFVATTSPMGAGKWKADYNQYCEGRLIAIICDLDDPGKRHGLSTAYSLHGTTAETRLIFLNRDLPEHTDVTDLVEKYNWMAKDFVNLIDKTPVFIPQKIGSQVVAQKLSDVERLPIQWLWFNRFAQGKLCLLVGNPGVGKSFMSLDMAARISTGGYWPDGKNLPAGSNQAPKGSVIILTAEDSLADTVCPRLDKMEADTNKIFAIEGVHLEKSEEQQKFWIDDKVPVTDFFDLSRDILLLEKKLSDIKDVKLIIIDPLSAYYGKADSHKNAAVRSILAPLAEIAERHNVCIIGISHLRKSASEAAIYRVTGSIGQTAAARATWLIHPDKENQDRRLFVCLKNNLSREKTGLAFEIVDGRIEYEHNIINESADDIFGYESEHGVNVQEAIEFLDGLFVEDPNPKAIDALEKARKAGISERTLRRAKTALNIISKKYPSGLWRWEKSEENEDLLL
jgi:Predicted ATP-dependent serine protease